MNRIAQALSGAIHPGGRASRWVAMYVRLFSVGVLLHLGLAALLLLGQQSLILHELKHSGELFAKHHEPFQPAGPDKCAQCLVHAGLGAAVPSAPSYVPELSTSPSPAKSVPYGFLPAHQTHFYSQGPPTILQS